MQNRNLTDAYNKNQKIYTYAFKGSIASSNKFGTRPKEGLISVIKAQSTSKFPKEYSLSICIWVKSTPCPKMVVPVQSRVLGLKDDRISTLLMQLIIGTYSLYISEL